MPYSIYVLDASDVDVTGAQLSGVTQGDGSHLVGRTLELRSTGWRPITIDDNPGDTDFSDNDGSQRLAGSETIDGVSYDPGTRVEAEFSFVVEDANGTQWTVVAFNVNNSNPAYGTVEGLAFIGPVGGFPPALTELTVVSAAEGPSFAAADYATPICFAAGTLIETSVGPVPVERLSPGTILRTADGGLAPLRWTARRRMPALGPAAPVRFAPGVLGNARPLIVSPQHRLLIRDWRAQLWAGQDEVLIPAKVFAEAGQATRCSGGWITYHHLLLDRHSVLLAEGVASESLMPGKGALAGLAHDARDWLLDRCRSLMDGSTSYGPPAALDLRGETARALLSA